ncbi:unnamed protein product, partial [Prorocentrum cordatum]
MGHDCGVLLFLLAASQTLNAEQPKDTFGLNTFCADCPSYRLIRSKSYDSEELLRDFFVDREGLCPALRVEGPFAGLPAVADGSDANRREPCVVRSVPFLCSAEASISIRLTGDVGDERVVRDLSVAGGLQAVSVRSVADGMLVASVAPSGGTEVLTFGPRELVGALGVPVVVDLVARPGEGPGLARVSGVVISQGSSWSLLHQGVGCRGAAAPEGLQGPADAARCLELALADLGHPRKR